MDLAAASPQIMDMYGGAPARFHMRGMSGSIVHDAHREDLKILLSQRIMGCLAPNGPAAFTNPRGADSVAGRAREGSPWTARASAADV